MMSVGVGTQLDENCGSDVVTMARWRGKEVGCRELTVPCEEWVCIIGGRSGQIILRLTCMQRGQTGAYLSSRGGTGHPWFSWR